MLRVFVMLHHVSLDYTILMCRSVRLNGDVLEMVDERTLPALQGAELPPGEPLGLPALSFGFYVLKQAAAPAC